MKKLSLVFMGSVVVLSLSTSVYAKRTRDVVEEKDANGITKKTKVVKDSSGRVIKEITSFKDAKGRSSRQRVKFDRNSGLVKRATNCQQAADGRTNCSKMDKNSMNKNILAEREAKKVKAERDAKDKEIKTLISNAGSYDSCVKLSSEVRSQTQIRTACYHLYGHEVRAKEAAVKAEQDRLAKEAEVKIAEEKKTADEAKAAQAKAQREEQLAKEAEAKKVAQAKAKAAADAKAKANEAIVSDLSRMQNTNVGKGKVDVERVKSMGTDYLNARKIAAESNAAVFVYQNVKYCTQTGYKITSARPCGGSKPAASRGVASDTTKLNTR